MLSEGDALLTYYMNEGDKEPKGAIPLRIVKQVVADGTSLELDVGYRRFHMIASSESDAVKWRDAIQAARATVPPSDRQVGICRAMETDGSGNPKMGAVAARLADIVKQAKAELHSAARAAARTQAAEATAAVLKQITFREAGDTEDAGGKEKQTHLVAQFDRLLAKLGVLPQQLLFFQDENSGHLRVIPERRQDCYRRSVGSLLHVVVSQVGEGEACLDVARVKHVVDALLAAGVSPSVTDAQGNTPASVAALHGCACLKRYLLRAEQGRGFEGVPSAHVLDAAREAVDEFQQDYTGRSMKLKLGGWLVRIEVRSASLASELTEAEQISVYSIDSSYG